MTKSTITREQVIALIAEHSYDSALVDALEYLLAAMDSEPVKRVNADQMRRVCLEANRHLDKYGAMAKEVNKLLGRISAQPAPVVPDAATAIRACLSEFPESARDIVEECADIAENACRAAMLQAQSSDDGEPTDDERIMAIEGIHNCERCGDEGWVAGEMGITRCECSQAGKSLVNGVTTGKPLTITLPDISSKAFWSGAGKNETFHPETYRRWVKEAVERACIVASIDVEVK